MGRATLWKFLILFAVGAVIGLVMVPFVLKSNMGGVFMGLSLLILLAFFGYVIWILAVRNKATIAASPEQKSAALKFQPVAGKGVLYVFRHQTVGLLAGMELVLDGKLLGQTRGYCFYRLEVEPGQHHLSGDKKCSGPLDVTVAADQVVFVEQELVMGAFSTTYRYLLQQGTDEVQRKLYNCKMMLPAS